MKHDPDPLRDFYVRLEHLRTRLNVARAEDRQLTFENWDEIIMRTGCEYLVTAQHLAPRRPPTLRATLGSDHAPPNSYVLTEDMPPSGLGGRAATPMVNAIANHVGLFADTLTLLLDAWMHEHGETDPSKPWRLLCTLTSRTIPGREHARWTLHIDGKRWADQPWEHAAQQALAWGPQARCELDYPNTCKAAGMTYVRASNL